MCTGLIMWRFHIYLPGIDRYRENTKKIACTLFSILPIFWQNVFGRFSRLALLRKGVILNMMMPPPLFNFFLIGGNVPRSPPPPLPGHFTILLIYNLCKLILETYSSLLHLPNNLQNILKSFGQAGSPLPPGPKCLSFCLSRNVGCFCLDRKSIYIRG